MKIKFQAGFVAIEQTLSAPMVQAELSANQVRRLVIELLSAMPEQEAAELIRSEFPDWLEA
jgi:hypothetical protein